MNVRFYAWSAALGASSMVAAQSQVNFSEIVRDASRIDASGWQYVEIKSGANQNLSNLTVIEISGGAENAGTITSALSLDNVVSGENGLLLLQNMEHQMSQNASTSSNVQSGNAFTLNTGTSTYLVVQNFTGQVGDSIDANMDGSVDATHWSAIEDSVAFGSGQAGEKLYGAEFGGVDFGGFGANNSADAYVVLTSGDKVAFEVAADGSAMSGTDGGGSGNGPLPADFKITPGDVNPVPEPASLVALGAGLGAAVLRRRRKSAK